MHRLEDTKVFCLTGADNVPIEEYQFTDHGSEARVVRWFSDMSTAQQHAFEAQLEFGEVTCVRELCNHEMLVQLASADIVSFDESEFAVTNLGVIVSEVTEITGTDAMIEILSHEKR
jgi:hypothetical protein